MKITKLVINSSIIFSYVHHTILYSYLNLHVSILRTARNAPITAKPLLLQLPLVLEDSIEMSRQAKQTGEYHCNYVNKAHLIKMHRGAIR